jgi:glyoxylase-like metal-dependent hydrolase (beta-lactamase superfamily II)
MFCCNGWFLKWMVFDWIWKGSRMAFQEVAAGVYGISLAWSFAYVLRAGEDVTLIDCGLRKDRPALVAGLRALGIEPDGVKTLLLTHAHCDHAGNASFFAAQGTSIVTHRDEVRFLEPPRQAYGPQPLPRSYAPRGMKALRRPLTALAFELGEVFYPVERCPVTRKVIDGEIVATPCGPLRVVHCPGHTPGHIAFYRECDQTLFSGDCVLNIIPIKRVTGLSLPIRMLSDDWGQARCSARRLAEIGPRLLLSGHGEPLADDTANRLRDWARTL